MSLVIARNLVTSARLCAGAKVRLARGEARSGNEYGPLTDLPDWSYAGACMFHTPNHLLCARLAHTPQTDERRLCRASRRSDTRSRDWPLYVYWGLRMIIAHFIVCIRAGPNPRAAARGERCKGRQ